MREMEMEDSPGTASTMTTKRLFRRLLPSITTIMTPTTVVPPTNNLPVTFLQDSGAKEKRLLWWVFVVGGAGLGLILILSGITLLWHRHKLKTSGQVKLRKPSRHHPQESARPPPEGQAPPEECSGQHHETSSTDKSPAVSRNAASVLSWGSEFDCQYTKENIYSNDLPVPHLPPKQPRNPVVCLLRTLHDTKGNNSDRVKFQISEVSNQRVREVSPSFRNKTFPSNRQGVGSPMVHADEAPNFIISEHSDNTARGHLYANSNHLQQAGTYVNTCQTQSSLNRQRRKSEVESGIYTDVNEYFTKSNRRC